MYLKSTEHTLCIYCDFVLRSEWSLIKYSKKNGDGSNKLLVVKGLKCIYTGDFSGNVKHDFVPISNHPFKLQAIPQ